MGYSRVKRMSSSDEIAYLSSSGSNDESSADESDHRSELGIKPYQYEPDASSSDVNVVTDNIEYEVEGSANRLGNLQW